MENLGLILSSSLIAAGLTKFLDYIIHRFTYKQEYHKLILNKRLQAYEQLDQLLQQMFVYSFDQDKVFPHAFFSKQANRKFSLILIRTMEYKLWLSTKTAKTLIDLFELIDKEVEKFEDINGDISDYKSIGISINEPFSKYADELRKLMVGDLEKLFKIKKFFEEKQVT